MRTILVSGTSGVVGYGILRSLKKTHPEIKLVGTTIYDDSVAQAFCDIFEKAPLTNSSDYIGWLIKTIKKHRVDMIIPGIEADMIAWNEARDILEKTKAHVLLNNLKLIKLCGDKWKFYKELESIGSEFLIVSRLSGSFDELKKEFGLPFLLKPRRGFASKGIIRISSEAEFNVHKKSLGAVVMAQPIIGSDVEEYTVSAFFDKNNKLLCKMSLKRKLSSEGYTEKAVVAEPKKIDHAITKLTNLFKPVGPTNFQFRIDNGQLKLLEINPRISSATSIRAAFGYNESSMCVDYFLDSKLPVQPVIRQGYAVRYIEDYIFYDSHTI